MFTEEYKDKVEELFINLEDYLTNIVEDEKIENLIKKGIIDSNSIMDATDFDFIPNITYQNIKINVSFRVDYDSVTDDIIITIVELKFAISQNNKSWNVLSLDELLQIIDKYNLNIPIQSFESFCFRIMA